MASGARLRCRPGSCFVLHARHRQALPGAVRVHAAAGARRLAELGDAARDGHHLLGSLRHPRECAGTPDSNPAREHASAAALVRSPCADAVQRGPLHAGSVPKGGAPPILPTRHSAVHTFASRRGTVGNLVEEPFTAVVGSTNAPVYLLPITEICRTIRRDVRAIAQCAATATAPSSSAPSPSTPHPTRTTSCIPPPPPHRLLPSSLPASPPRTCASTLRYAAIAKNCSAPTIQKIPRVQNPPEKSDGQRLQSSTGRCSRALSATHTPSGAMAGQLQVAARPARQRDQEKGVQRDRQRDQRRRRDERDGRQRHEEDAAARGALLAGVSVCGASVWCELSGRQRKCAQSKVILHDSAKCQRSRPPGGPAPSTPASDQRIFSLHRVGWG